MSYPMISSQLPLKSRKTKTDTDTKTEIENSQKCPTVFKQPTLT